MPPSLCGPPPCVGVTSVCILLPPSSIGGVALGAAAAAVGPLPPLRGGAAFGGAGSGSSNAGKSAPKLSAGVTS
eukprot:CAMPEP_0185916472 /NCGR_PEP_ID=MMETSP0924C-20121207/3499_1 /TAXON_ID=321610 /ORGANISM="Perkinsus chesapeaki, Strain ATCC PRA-65" /LENGTH=73 /DNA_ID=CAMNT_0028641617 /DNA_START=225 /DNA_END=442 /DNA_ORIENTATION=-